MKNGFQFLNIFTLPFSSHTKEGSEANQETIFEVLLLTISTIALVAYILKIIPQGLQLPVFSTITIIGLLPVLNNTWRSLWQRRASVDLLAAIALIFSLYEQSWGSVLFINVMLILARLLNINTMGHVRESIESLIKLRPSVARVMRGKEVVTTPLENVIAGDLVVVNLGEQMPIDGTVVDGTATISQSSLTGESAPILKSPGDAVLSATVIVSGNLIVRAERVGSATTFEKMVKLVSRSQSEKTRMQTSVERFASWYIGVILVGSIIVYLVTKDKTLTLSFLLVVCADDIAVAIPLAYLGGIAAAAKKGIIVKGADFLEGAAKITTLIVDKTGTLTRGVMVVKNVKTFNEFSLPYVLELSRTMCHASTHPVAKAICDYTTEQKIAYVAPEKFVEIEGRGMKGLRSGREILVGRMDFLNESGIIANYEVMAAIKEEELQGSTLAFVAQDEKIIGFFSLVDEIRPGMADIIARLGKSGIRETIMMTGDNKAVAQVVAKNVGIETYYANLLPENKVTILEHYLKKKHTVGMVGDGVNDAAVLARADIGIAMGGIGSDAAIESADIVLMKDDLSKIVELRTISNKVLSVARGNFAIWVVVNIAGLTLVFSGMLDPAQAAAYNFITDFIPIANSLRIFKA